jgi:hypothetical protein
MFPLEKEVPSTQHKLLLLREIWFQPFERNKKLLFIIDVRLCGQMHCLSTYLKYHSQLHEELRIYSLYRMTKWVIIYNRPINNCHVPIEGTLHRQRRIENLLMSKTPIYFACTLQWHFICLYNYITLMDVYIYIYIYMISSMTLSTLQQWFSV